MTLQREVEPIMRANQIVLAAIASLAVLLASQQCAGQVRTRLDAVIARDPLPRAVKHIACDVAREVRKLRRSR